MFFVWVYFVVLLKVYFSDGIYKEGYVILFKNGCYIVFFEMFYFNGLYFKMILVKM